MHNARCAFVSGLAFAQGKAVLMVQEEEVAQPIDYRDLVRSYSNPAQVPELLEPVFRRTIELIQVAYGTKSRPARGSLLEVLDLGDGAAENEVPGLARYFVPTGQFRHISRGHARLVVGRKGSGKTAIFFEIRAPLINSRSRLVVDLRPDGPQFGKLRAFLAALDPALQEHTMMAFWTYLLLSEFAKRIVDEYSYAKLEPRRLEKWERVEEIYSALAPGPDIDFSQRLLVEVNRVLDAWSESSDEGLAPDVTEKVFSGDIRQLRRVTSEYLAEKDEIWVLVDNLDKSWPIRGSNDQDIAMLRGLLEAARKIQRDFEDLGVTMNCLVFLRTDIYDHLLGLTPDKGKDTIVRLDWEDPTVFQEIVHKRIEASVEVSGEFRQQVWPTFFDSFIGVEDSFNFVVSRTLMRPRDLLNFLQRCIEVALNRGHDRVSSDDILHAERGHSEELLTNTAYEIQDTHPALSESLFDFHGASSLLSRDEVEEILLRAGVESEGVPAAIETLLWFDFLGVASPSFDEEMYSYSVQANLRRLLHPIERGEALFVVHPAFRSALEIRS